MIDLDLLAGAIVDAERASDRKVWIASVWQRYVDRAPSRAWVELDAFKRALAALNASRAVTLTRWDYVEGLDEHGHYMFELSEVSSADRVTDWHCVFVD